MTMNEFRANLNGFCVFCVNDNLIYKNELDPELEKESDYVIRWDGSMFITIKNRFNDERF